MAQRQTAEDKSNKNSRAERDEPQDAEPEATTEGDDAVDEKELADYLTERIKPGLNRGAIPLLARSIAREIARDEYHSEEPDDEAQDGADATDLETDLHTLQERLGEDWTLLYAVHSGDAWLTAENMDATQRVEAPTAEVLVQAVELLKRGGGRSGGQRSESKD